MLPSGLDEEVAGYELLARFARDKDLYFKKDPKRPKGNLFIPKRGYTVLSVSRVSNLTTEAIRELGEHVVSMAGDDLFGWCTIRADQARSVNELMVVSDEPDDDHYYHAHIEGFPHKIPSTVPGQKSELMQVCDALAELASDMTLV